MSQSSKRSMRFRSHNVRFWKLNIIILQSATVSTIICEDSAKSVRKEQKMMGKQGNQKNEHHGREWLSFPDMSRIYDLKGGQGYDDDDPLDGDGGALHPVRTGYGAVGPGGRGGGGGDPGGGGAVPVHCGDAVPVDRGDGGDAAVRAGRKAVPAASTDAPAALSPG